FHKYAVADQRVFTEVRCQRFGAGTVTTINGRNGGKGGDAHEREYSCLNDWRKAVVFGCCSRYREYVFCKKTDASGGHPTGATKLLNGCRQAAMHGSGLQPAGYADARDCRPHEF